MTRPEAPRDLVVITWDGQGPLHQCVYFDATPRCELLTFDYSGAGQLPEQRAENHFFLSKRTECKGHIYQEMARYLDLPGDSYRYIGLIDDDIIIRMSDINHMLHIAGLLDLHSFAASLTHDSFYSHQHTLHQHERLFHPVSWVEVMMPFYSVELFRKAAPFFHHAISSWGIDFYVMPLVQKIAEMERVAIIDAVKATHFRPVRSVATVFSNGLTAREESERLRLICADYVRENHPDLLATEWFLDRYGQPK